MDIFSLSTHEKCVFIEFEICFLDDKAIGRKFDTHIALLLLLIDDPWNEEQISEDIDFDGCIYMTSNELRDIRSSWPTDNSPKHALQHIQFLVFKFSLNILIDFIGYILKSV